MVDPNFWKELKSKFNKNPLDQVVSSSHLIDFTSKKKKLIKPATINCNLPLNPEVKKQQEAQNLPPVLTKKISIEEDDDDKQNKTTTAKVELNSFQKALLLSGIAGASANECVKVISYSIEEDKWIEMDKPEIATDKSKEQMSLEFPVIQSTKFFMLRVNRNITLENLTKSVRIIESEFALRNTLIILLKSTKNPYKFLLLTCLKIRSEKTLNQLKDDGYIIDPQNSPVQIELKERQIITTQFSGNIQHVNTEKNTMHFTFHSLFQNIQKFETKAIDTYAQRAIDNYRGFIVVYTKKMVRKPVESGDKKTKKGQTNYQMVEENVMVCQLLVSIPKRKLVSHKPLQSTPFNRLLLEDLMLPFTRIADSVSASWKDLGTVLHISESRLQSLKHNNPSHQCNKIIIQMLVFWVKGLEIQDNKLELLRLALLDLNRPDLATIISENTEEYEDDDDDR